MNATVKERLKACADYFGMSMREFEREAGLFVGYASRVKNINAKRAQMITKAFPMLNLEFIRDGVGPMFVEDYEPKGNAGAFVSMQPRNDFPTIRLLQDIFGTATAVEQCMEGEREVFVDYPVTDSELQDKVGITIQGESMTPTIPNKSIAVLDSRWVDLNNIPERIYLVITKDRRMVKRVVDREDAIICISDNSDKTFYPNVVIPKNEILFLYPVVRILFDMRL